MSAEDGEVWSALPASSFQADGRIEVFFSALGNTEAGSMRIAKRDRPWQSGAKLDDVGSNSDDFQLRILFHNDVSETDLGGSLQPWPNAHDELLDQFHLGATGTLNLPWKRGIRCKATQWQSVTSADDTRGGAIVTVTFTTDNEDSLDREALELASVTATVNGAVEAATFDMDSLGMFDGSIEDITELAANLVGLLNSPNDELSAILHAARRVRRAVGFVMDSFSTAIPGRDQMNGADGASARLSLLSLLELAGRAEGEALSALPKTRTVVFPRVRDIYSIATEVGQSARTLMSINDSIEDLSFIPAGTPVRILAS
jgi:hypothetical protein